MPSKRTLVTLAFALSCFGALCALERWEPDTYWRLENACRDAIARAGRLAPANPDLVFLAIDSDSVGLDQSADVEAMYGLSSSGSPEARALTLMSNLWPWSREVYGLILDRLVQAGARVVVFDLTFPTPSDNDPPFREALDRYRDRVIVGSNFVSATSRGFSIVGASHTRPPETLIPQTTPIDGRVAYTNFWPDGDDVVRRAQYRVTFEQLQQRVPTAESEVFISLAGRALQLAGFGDRVPGGLDSQVFRFTAPPRQGFRPRSVFEIFVPEYWDHNYASGAFFKDKVVLIGAEGNWQHDEHRTPFGSMPGPELHLNAMNAALHREFISELSPAGELCIAAVAAAVAMAMTLRIRSPWWRIGTLAALNIAFGWGVLEAFNRLSLYLPIVGPAGVLDASVLLGLMSDFAGERLEKARVRRTLERYVSSDVVRELLDKPKLYAEALGGVVKPVSILFSDIRGYSTVSARTDPQALVAQLNEYLTAMVECVFEYGGTLDKFIGDAVMAVWGNTRTEGARGDAANAVRAAIAMRAALVRLNEGWRERGLPELRAGIAINHGRVVVGNIGSPRRMEFTVVGDAVNTSWRLQELTKVFGFDLLVGENVAKLLIEDFDLRPLGSASVRTDETMEVFAVLGPIDAGAQAAASSEITDSASA